MEMLLGFILGFILFGLLPSIGLRPKWKDLGPAFKIYRWWKGGRWVFHHDAWRPVKEPSGYVIHQGYGYHWNFQGIEKREDYRLKVFGQNYPPDYERPPAPPAPRSFNTLE